jgi:hypothetical protein
MWAKITIRRQVVNSFKGRGGDEQFIYFRTIAPNQNHVNKLKAD